MKRPDIRCVGPLRSSRGLVGIVAILVLGAAAVIYYVSFFGVRRGPSFIARLQSGQTVSQDIVRMEILRFNPSSGWPFNERDYDKLERVAVTERSTVENILAVLKTDSTIGIQQRNHPGTLHYGIFRIELRGGEHFYLYYSVHRDKTGDYVSVAANSAGSTNPNGAEAYESTGIVSLLQREDPWFRKQ